jgi:hypothetical protein
MVKAIILFLFSSFLVLSCAPVTQIPSGAPIIAVYATSAAQPWLSELYACANGQSVVLNVKASNPQIHLQVGEPANLVSSSYQIDEEEILIVTHRESAVQNLTFEEAQALFAGQGDPSAQVWVYASDADLQISFDQLVMKGRSVSSSARVAADAQEMSDALNVRENAVGILPRHWLAGDAREVYSAGKVPVLAILNGEETETIRTLLTCLSK